MGIVYLLEEDQNDERVFKIGFTTRDINKRIRQLQTGNSSIIRLVHSYETENYSKVEKMLHSKYNLHHKRGEWFYLPKEQISDFLDECKRCDEIATFMLDNNHFYN